MALVPLSTAPRLRPSPASPGCGLRVPVASAWPPAALTSPARVAVPVRRRHRPGAPALAGRTLAVPPVPLVLAALLVALALLVAPEQPRDQEAICQRQAGVEACRVW
jgi:hypothetical protein